MKNYREATNYLCDIFEDLIVQGDFKYGESTFLWSILRTANLIRYVKPNRLRTSNPVDRNEKQICSYAVLPFVAQALTELAERDESFFDCCAEICQLNLLADAHLPFHFRVFAARVVGGDLSRPTKKSRPFKRNWHETSVMYLAALDVSDNFDLVLTRNDEGANKSSACDAVAEALTVCGRKTMYSELKYLAVHPDKKKFREQVQVNRKLMARLGRIERSGRFDEAEANQFIQSAVMIDVLDIVEAYFTEEQISSFDS